MANDEATEWPPAPVTKSALCRFLGWSRPKLDLRLETDTRFPVLQRGVRGGAWRFDPAAVIAYLRGEPDVAGGLVPAPKRAASGGGVRAASQRSPIVHVGEETARQRRDVVQTEILMDKLRRERAELVQSVHVKHMLSTLLAHIGASLDSFGGQLSAKLKASVDGEAAIRGLIDELKNTAALELRSLMEDRRA